jgi:hypothetical protein
MVIVKPPAIAHGLCHGRRLRFQCGQWHLKLHKLSWNNAGSCNTSNFRADRCSASALINHE